MTRSFFDDQDPAETREWLDSLASIIEHEGPERASWLLDRLTDTATELAGQAFFDLEIDVNEVGATEYGCSLILDRLNVR